MQEKLFIQWGRFSFFFRPKLPTLYSKINDNSRLRTTRFSSSRFGVRVTAVPNIFTIYPQHFSIPEISETLKGSPTKFFGTVRQKIFDGKSWYSPLIHKFFDTRNFVKQNGPLTKFFGPVRQKKFGKTMMPPSPSYAWKFSIQEFFWNTEGVSDEVFRYCGAKIFDTKSWYPFFMQKTFSIIEIFWYTELFPIIIFRYRETKILNEKSWYHLFFIKLQIVVGIDVCRKPSKTRF